MTVYAFGGTQSNKRSFKWQAGGTRRCKFQTWQDNQSEVSKTEKEGVGAIKAVQEKTTKSYD